MRIFFFFLGTCPSCIYPGDFTIVIRELYSRMFPEPRLRRVIGCRVDMLECFRLTFCQKTDGEASLLNVNTLKELFAPLTES